VDKKPNSNNEPIIRWRRDFKPLPQTPPPQKPEKAEPIPVVPVRIRRRGIRRRKRIERDPNQGVGSI
jgi:hypothetical protein